MLVQFTFIILMYYFFLLELNIEDLHVQITKTDTQLKKT